MNIKFLPFSVIRAKVLSQEIEGWNRVIGLRILKTYKGATRLNETGEIQYYGSKQRSLFAKAYTAKDGGTCGVDWLTNGSRYIIAGRIWKGKLRLSLCNFMQEWSEVLTRRVVRNGLKRFYGPNCGCQLSPCYGGDCGKLQGCGTTIMTPSRNPCEWNHSYCVKNSNGTACAWHETPEYKNCMAVP